MNHLNNERNDDRQLLKAIQANESWALKKLIANMLPRLCALAVELVKDSMQAEDLAMEAIEKAWERSHQFDNLPSFENYMNVTVRNSGLNFLRHIKKEKQYEQEMAAAPEPSADDADYYAERADALKVWNELLKGFNSRQQMVARYSLLEQLTDKEIAKELNIQVKTVQNQKSTIMGALRNFIRKKMHCLFIIV